MAETIKIDIPHKLTREAARVRLEESFAKMRDKAVGGMVKFEDVWTGDRLDFQARMMGQSITGRLDVLDDSVHVELQLPGFLAAMAGKVVGHLKREGTLLLEKK
ncbi:MULTISPECIES: polyhydroxyalkanoic acid system family protein [unclassified Aureimonas]|uniref:polyhydroxyalkanoic acid system family protein n=1 Tax=unclassified Aureimonas TaxID=2615206 RepID=UPI0006FA7C3A|nr:MULTISPECIES: polyhydroxyalkanoic acid system family protein [unclassified Aureimonas]KQT66100.1 hypothetical protein ASG62_20015 [Aureimonas sp. Leaf427]KQT81036.1 hypothetical protein ASG54_06235 [Aureimonas sp. Leaf460]